MTNDSHFNAEYDYSISVVDIFTLDKCAIIHQAESTKSISIALVQQGYLRTTPESPSLAMSLCTLELYYRIRRRKPSFSIEAFAKVLCDFYMMPYHRQYRDGLSNAFDIYLAVLRIIDKCVAKELGCDAENWRILNSCPPSSNILEDEPPLKFSQMFVLDGNNSLKRVGLPGNRQVGDLRTFKESNYYISNKFVNGFANEVKKPQQNLQQKSLDIVAAIVDVGAASKLEDDSILIASDNAGDPTDDVHTMKPCAKNWKAAFAESNKKMWGIFDESGIFASACRHGFILWIIDMVWSGELAKYPLAIIAKALNVLPPEFLIAYDIGCIFDGTIARSLLGLLFKERHCVCCINTFHGYSHNFLCQVQYHPSIIEGMGLEDLKTLEHQWDQEKYESLGTMLYNNYTQALHIIKDDGPKLAHAKQEFNIQEGDLGKWRLNEKEYFLTLRKEPEEHGNLQIGK
ncbi:hypothetical protein C0993_012378 [Termitomyces sp. T159_Od127]|nr:hypothetical protein C0993_012378 [Termitomyces sp. T159_Od127]